MFKFLKKKGSCRATIAKASSILDASIENLQKCLNDLLAHRTDKVQAIINCYHSKSEYEAFYSKPEKWFELFEYIENDLSNKELYDRFDQIKKIITQCESIIYTNQKEFEVEIMGRIQELIAKYQKLSHYAADPNNELYSDDFDHLIDIRESIHILYALIKDTKREEISNIKTNIIESDLKLVNLIKNNPLKNQLFFSHLYPESHWWHHLHELDKLSKKDLETI